MPNTTTNLAELASAAHIGMIVNNIGQAEPSYPMFFDVGGQRQKSETQVRYAGGGMWDYNTEGSTFNDTEVKEGDTVTFTAKRIDQAYKLTHELLMDDLYNVIERGQGQGNTAVNFARGFIARIESDCADIINDGFDTAGYDGAYLFADAQTCINSASTWDNKSTAALSAANLASAEELMRSQVNDDGTYANAKGDLLIVARNLEFTARSIISDTDPNTNSTINVLSRNVTPKYGIIVNNYLTDDYWALKDKNVKNLELRWRERPLFGSNQIPNTVDYNVYGYARYSVGYSEKRGLVASNASA